MKRGRIVQLLSNRAVTVSVDSRQNGLHLFGTTAGALSSAGFGELEFILDRTDDVEAANISVEVKSDSKLNEIKRAVCNVATAKKSTADTFSTRRPAAALPDAHEVFERIQFKATRSPKIQTPKIQKQEIADRMRENLAEWIKGTLDAALATKTAQTAGADYRRY